MNVVGIEYRPTIVCIALREGVHPAQLIGDGCRDVIPAVATDTSWGSAAAAAPASAWNGLTSTANTGRLWQGLRYRLSQFKGSGSPSNELTGTVIATNGRALEIIPQAADAGFEASFIVPPEAALAAWLARQQGTDDLVVVAVTIGDITSEACGFRVRTGPRPALLEATPAVSTPVGVAHSVARAVEEIEHHVVADQLRATRFNIWQSAFEIGERLRRGGAEASVLWTGPLSETMLQPLAFTMHDVLRWPSCQELSMWVGRTARSLAARLKCARPNVLLVSGLGASWPIAAEAFAGLPAPVIAANPGGEVAIGAAWWPTIATASSLPCESTLESSTASLDLSQHAKQINVGDRARNDISHLLEKQLKEIATDDL